MAIDLATGFNIGSKDAIDERQVLTLEQMKNLDESIYPDNYFAICKDNGKLYIFNASNEINAETGKFRVLSGGTGGGDTTYVLPPATDTTLGGVKVDNVTITVDSEGVITAINAYTKTEVDDLLNNKLDKPAVDGTAGQILVLQDDGSLAYEDNVGSGNVEAMADLILDTEVRLDKTYSSSKIYTDIQQCLEDSKTYTLEELEKVKIDDTLTTTDKTIVGAINEVKLSIPTRTSELENNSNFITNDDLPTVPTKVSDLENDRGYLTSIPEEYITETELNAKGYLTSHQDISGLQTKTDNNLTTTSKEVVGAINEVKDMADLILDTEVRIDKTYSSSKIYSDIQDAIDSSKNFTLNEIGKMSGASYKVVTSTAEMTDGKIIYLLENGATYDMYIVEEAGTVTKIGNTAIDLSSYLKVTDAESAYLKKTEATSTYATQTSFNNHITDTVAHLTQLEKNKLLTTDNITSTINNNSDNTQIPSAKATYDLANTKANTNHTHNTSDITDLSIPSNVSELTNDAGYISEVINNLTSTDTDKPLSANQGKVLKDELAKLETKRVYNNIRELNAAKGLSIAFTNGEDNTMKIVDALSPIETFADFFTNTINENRFGIDTNTYGNEISLLTITRFQYNIVIIRAYMSNGKLLMRRYQNGVLRNWQYDKGNSSELTNMNTKLIQLETKQIETQKDLDELFQSVSNGKTLVANAITDKGVSTSTTATFATMATNISKIPQTMSCKEETVSAAADSTTRIAKFIFSNTVLGVRQLTPEGYHYKAEVKGTKMFRITGNCVEVYFPDGGTWHMTAGILQ